MFGSFYSYEYLRVGTVPARYGTAQYLRSQNNFKKYSAFELRGRNLTNGVHPELNSACNPFSRFSSALFSKIYILNRDSFARDPTHAASSQGRAGPRARRIRRDTRIY